MAWRLALPGVLLYLSWRALRQPEYLRHWRERFGWHPSRGDARPLIWLHAVSVGETRAVQALVMALAQRYPQARFLFTSMTPTGRAVVHELFALRLGVRLAQAYLPYDIAAWQRRFLRAWRPTLGLLVETEVWPNLVAVARQAEVPLGLINARLSERSRRRGQRQRWLVTPAAQQLSYVLAQSVADAQRMTQLGARVLAVTGNLKFDNQPHSERVAQGRLWRARIGRPVVLAASTREGEETLIVQAWSAQVEAQGALRPLLVLVPRHPQRFDAAAQAAQSWGWRTVRRAALDDSATDWSEVDVLIGDSMGEMDAWYGLATVTIMGGSLRPFGSQNLIEACAVGCPVILGPSVFNFAAAAAEAMAAGAARQVTTVAAAVALALELARAPAEAAAMGQAGMEFTARHGGATQRTLAALSPWLVALQRPEASC